MRQAELASDRGLYSGRVTASKEIETCVGPGALRPPIRRQLASLATGQGIPLRPASCPPSPSPVPTVGWPEDGVGADRFSLEITFRGC